MEFIEDSINPAYQEFFRCQKPICILYGGAGAGKTYAVAQYLALKLLYLKNRKIVISRKTLASLKLTCLPIFLKILEQYRIKYRFNKSEYVLETPGENQAVFLSFVNTSGEEAERLKSITDVTDWWIEEATELTKEEFIQAQLRLRGKPLEEGTRQLILTFNPVNTNHWLYETFFLKPSDDVFIGKYTYEDNQFLDQEYVKTLENLKNLNPDLYTVYALGDWAQLGDLIYKNWEVRNIEEEYFEDYIAGLDFGYTHPSAYVLIGIRENIAYILAEGYSPYLSNAELMEMIDSINQEWNVNPNIYADYSDPDRIMELSGKFNIYPADKDVVAGIRKVQSYRLVINSTCQNTIKEIKGYSWQKDRNGRLKEEPVKFNDHLMDAIRYALYSHKNNILVTIPDDTVPSRWRI